MAQIDNPKKGFQFNVFTAGLLPYAVQEITGLEKEIDQVAHGDIASDIQTAGRVKYPNIKLDKLRPIGMMDNWLWNWMELVRDSQTGGGLLASRYKRNLDIEQYSYDNITKTDIWEVYGTWPCKLNGLELSRTKSENSMESIELSVDSFKKIL